MADLLPGTLIRVTRCWSGASGQGVDLLKSCVGWGLIKEALYGHPRYSVIWLLPEDIEVGVNEHDAYEAVPPEEWPDEVCVAVAKYRMENA